jgi:hypothetical protein
MPNPSPYKARLGKRRHKKPGDLPALTRVLWRAVLEAQEILEAATEPELKLKAIHALSQCAGQYSKLLEVGEFEARLAAVEAWKEQH